MQTKNNTKVFTLSMRNVIQHALLKTLFDPTTIHKVLNSAQTNSTTTLVASSLLQSLALLLVA